MKISDAYHLMAKPSGPLCNLDCTYCFYLEKENLFPKKNNWIMNEKVLENYTKQYIQSQQTNEINFTWQGGEPTLAGLDFFRKAIELQKKYSNGKNISNSFQTNGVLLNDDWCKFFADNNFLIGISIDGPEEYHNRYRVFKGGQPTFDKVINAIELLKKYKVDFNTLTCVNKFNSYHPLEVYHFLKEIDSHYIQFIPIVERISLNKNEELKLIKPNYHDRSIVSSWSVESLQYGKFLSIIFDEWVRNDVGKYFVQIFDVSLESWLDMPQSLCVFRETCGNAMVIEHNGDVYSCDHYVYPDNKLGNIIEEGIASIVDKPEQTKFGLDKRDTLPNYCLNCDVRFACNGECPKHRFIKTPDGEDGLNYLCEGYKYFFHKIDVYMKFMANEIINNRAPANIMEWVKEKDKGFPSLKVNRNDLCPCGSNKKYKNCCMK